MLNGKTTAQAQQKSLTASCFYSNTVISINATNTSHTAHVTHTTIFIGPRCPWGPIYGSWCQSVSQSLQEVFADLTDVTLADEDSNLIPTDDVNMAILGNMAMQVAPCGGQHWN